MLPVGYLQAAEEQQCRSAKQTKGTAGLEYFTFSRFTTTHQQTLRSHLRKPRTPRHITKLWSGSHGIQVALIPPLQPPTVLCAVPLCNALAEKLLSCVAFFMHGQPHIPYTTG
jgi:hypothetical protein